ncbi:MAG: hypothetical protein KGM24_11170, partial [Elusimicrobia bacterium]|nr:hypothetical protein [Elusimicrobiota bacterium]
MDEQKAQFQLIAGAIAGFIGVVAAGAFLLLSGGPKAPRLPYAAAPFPKTLSAPPPAGNIGAGAPVGQAAPAAVVASSPVPLMPEEGARAAAPSAAAPA